MPKTVFDFYNRPVQDLWKDKAFTREACRYVGVCSGGSGSGTLQEVLTAGNVASLPIIIGPSNSTPLSGYAVYLGGNAVIADGSGDLRLRDLLDEAGLYHNVVHAFASSTTGTAQIHLSSGPSNITNVCNIAILTTVTSAEIFLADASGNTLTFFPTSISLRDNTNSAGNSVTVTNNPLSSIQTQFLPDLSGLHSVYKHGRLTGLTTPASGITALTVGALDASYVVSCNINVTTATLHNFGIVCNYTDETNTARIATFNFSTPTGTLGTVIVNTNGAVPYEGLPMHIRCKAGTGINIGTSSGGTYTTVVYNFDAVITQVG